MKPRSSKSVLLVGLLFGMSMLIMSALNMVAQRSSRFNAPLSTQTPSLIVSASIKNSLLVGNNTCVLPCWQGITPGLTTISDALQALENSPLICKNSLQFDEPSSSSGRAFWNWKDSVASPGDDYPVLKWEGGIVIRITLFLGTNVSVEEIIAKFGVPEQVSASDLGLPEAVEWGVTLYYPSTGFAAQIISLSGPDEEELNPSDVITYIVLLAPSPIEEMIPSLGRNIENTQIYDWKGYGNVVDLYVKAK